MLSFSPRIGGRKWCGVPFTQRSMSMKKDTVTLLSPQWGSNSKVQNISVQLVDLGFQSPQWGSNSKVKNCGYENGLTLFQSPQWGSNSKVENWGYRDGLSSFSPRNGEAILKL